MIRIEQAKSFKGEVLEMSIKAAIQFGRWIKPGCRQTMLKIETDTEKFEISRDSDAGIEIWDFSQETPKSFDIPLHLDEAAKDSIMKQTKDVFEGTLDCGTSIGLVTRDFIVAARKVDVAKEDLQIWLEGRKEVVPAFELACSEAETDDDMHIIEIGSDSDEMIFDVEIRGFFSKVVVQFLPFKLH